MVEPRDDKPLLEEDEDEVEIEEVTDPSDICDPSRVEGDMKVKEEADDAKLTVMGSGVDHESPAPPVEDVDVDNINKVEAKEQSDMTANDANKQELKIPKNDNASSSDALHPSIQASVNYASGPQSPALIQPPTSNESPALGIHIKLLLIGLFHNAVLDGSMYCLSLFEDKLKEVSHSFSIRVPQFYFIRDLSKGKADLPF